MHKTEAEHYWAGVFRRRRNAIRHQAGDGVILWLGQVPQPRNYEGNAFPFRQDSHFLYYTGLPVPNLALLTYPETDRDVLFAPPGDIDAVIWSGPGPSREELARTAGIGAVEGPEGLEPRLAAARSRGGKIRYLPPYRASAVYRLCGLLGQTPEEVAAGVSRPLMEAVAAERSVKSGEEIDQIEQALELTGRMHRACMAAARPGVRERELAGLIQAIALSEGRQQAFAPIVTVHGEVLHNTSCDGILEEGRLLLNDSGAESPMHYASDITRTFPVSGRYSGLQADMYRLVIEVQREAIARIRPGATNREVHARACRVLAEGLRGMGLMKGDAGEASAAGAHALFFPHGIGHMMGLDVHDMEDLGDIVGYRDKEPRSSQFGLQYLRLSRPLEPGFVLTVEPGVYFIPGLIDRWKSERRHEAFIDYGTVDRLRGFGGIRIEDNVVVTREGARILGPAIPRTIPEVEEACARPLAGGWPPSLS